VKRFALAASDPYQREASLALDIADQAADLVVAMRESATRAVKHDGTIVTGADLASAELIRKHLSVYFPDDAILTEEDSAESDRLTRRRCWIIDPIDGTQQFADGLDDYDIFIALAVAGLIEVAATVQPPTGTAMVATAESGLLIREGTSQRQRRFGDQAAVPGMAPKVWVTGEVSLARLRPAIEALGGIVTIPNHAIGPRTFLEAPAAGVCLYVPREEADLYEWDVAPLDIFMRAGGGWSSDARGQALQFNKADPCFPNGIVLATDSALGRRIVRALAG